MTATNHGLFGAALAIALQAHPLVAVALSPLSHFVLDALPHYGDERVGLRSRRFGVMLAFDATLAVVSTLVIAWVWNEIALQVVVCAFLAASPDLMWIYYVYVRPELAKKHALPRFHGWIQWSQTQYGLFVEIIWYATWMSLLVYFGVTQ